MEISCKLNEYFPYIAPYKASGCIRKPKISIYNVVFKVLLVCKMTTDLVLTTESLQVKCGGRGGSDFAATDGHWHV